MTHDGKEDDMTKPNEVTETDLDAVTGAHKDWIIIESMSSPLFHTTGDADLEGTFDASDFHRRR